MRFSRVSFTAGMVLGVCLSGSANAEGWILQAGSGGCYVEFLTQPVIDGYYQLVTGEGCSQPPFDGLTAWREEGGGWILESSNGMGFTPLARLDRQPDGSYAGIYGDGDPLTMRPADDFGAAPAAPNPPSYGSAPVDGSSPSLGSAKSCRMDVATGGCVDPSDDVEPQTSSGWPSVETKTRMNVRSSPSLGATKLGTSEARMCFDAIRCEYYGPQLWCAIPYGGRTGWLLRSDDEKVYLQNGCG